MIWCEAEVERTLGGRAGVKYLTMIRNLAQENKEWGSNEPPLSTISQHWVGMWIIFLFSNDYFSFECPLTGQQIFSKWSLWKFLNWCNQLNIYSREHLYLCDLWMIYSLLVTIKLFWIYLSSSMIKNLEL